MAKKQPLGIAAVNYGKQFLGKPYVWGGTDPSGFDCSGFVQYTYRKLGVSLPRTSAAQWDYLRRRGKGISINQLQPGDLVFFGSKKYGVSDVKMYAGGGKLIGASGGQKLKGSVKMLRLGYRTDYMGFAAMGRGVNGIYPMSFDAPGAQVSAQDPNARGTAEVQRQAQLRQMIFGSLRQPASTTWQREPVRGEEELRDPNFLELEEGALT